VLVDSDTQTLHVPANKVYLVVNVSYWYLLTLGHSHDVQWLEEYAVKAVPSYTHTHNGRKTTYYTAVNRDRKEFPVSCKSIKLHPYKNIQPEPGTHYFYHPAINKVVKVDSGNKISILNGNQWLETGMFTYQPSETGRVGVLDGLDSPPYTLIAEKGVLCLT
jgi:hypothetical protein